MRKVALVARKTPLIQRYKQFTEFPGRGGVWRNQAPALLAS